MLCCRCALAVNQGNDRDATDLLAELRHKSSPYGTPTQRMAHYFMEALVSSLCFEDRKYISNSQPEIVKGNC